jgi:hypothetical protein
VLTEFGRELSHLTPGFLKMMDPERHSERLSWMSSGRLKKSACDGPTVSSVINCKFVYKSARRLPSSSGPAWTHNTIRKPLSVILREACFSSFGGRQAEMEVAVKTSYDRSVGIVR